MLLVILLLLSSSSAVERFWLVRTRLLLLLSFNRRPPFDWLLLISWRVVGAATEVVGNRCRNAEPRLLIRGFFFRLVSVRNVSSRERDFVCDAFNEREKFRNP